MRKEKHKLNQDYITIEFKIIYKFINNCTVIIWETVNCLVHGSYSYDFLNINYKKRLEIIILLQVFWLETIIFGFLIYY